MRKILVLFALLFALLFAGLTASAQKVDLTRNVTGVLPLANGGRAAVTLTDFAGADASAQLTAAVTRCKVLTGCTIYVPPGTYSLPSKVTVDRSNIAIVGAGSGRSHDAGGQKTDATTVFRWTGAAGGTMLEFISPSGPSNQKQSGGGVQGVYFDANGAGVGLSVQSWNRGVFSDLMFLEFSQSALSMNVVAELAEARDPQKNLFQGIGFRQVATAGTAFTLDGGTGAASGANTSMNRFVLIDVNYADGEAVSLKNSDNNHFEQLRIFRAGSGTGNSLVFYGADDSAAHVSRANVFWGFSANVAPIARGTTSFTYASHDNSFYGVDADNSTPLPTKEAGATVYWSDTIGTDYDRAGVHAIAGASASEVASARALGRSNSLLIYNGSDAHVALADGAGTIWLQDIHTATGDLVFRRAAAPNKPNAAVYVEQDFGVSIAGRGLRVKEGSNAKQGTTSAMTAGSVTVSNTSVTASSRIFLSRSTAGGTLGQVSYSKSAGSGFTITSTSATETSSFDYQIFEPAP